MVHVDCSGWETKFLSAAAGILDHVKNFLAAGGPSIYAVSEVALNGTGRMGD